MERQKREYSLFTAIAMIVGIVIGSGIFFKSDDMLAYTGGNVGLAVLIFCIASFTIVFGSLCFSQLAARTDKPGGPITYYNEFVGKRWAVMFGWFQIFVYYPTLTVVLSWVTGIYFCSLFGLDWGFNGWLGVGFIWFLICYSFNIASAKAGGRFQEVSVIIKLIPLFVVAIGGVIFGDPIGVLMNPSPEAIEATKTLTWVAAIGPVAFSFDGWVVSMAVAHEVKDSRRNMPRALVAAPICILAAYLLYFLGICGYIGPEQVMEMGDASVTLIAESLMGPTFATLITAFVTISVMGTTNGVILGSIRLPYSLALRNALPGSGGLKKLNPRSKMPVNSSIFAMIVCLIWWGIHFLQNQFAWLVNGDISEIAIAMSYLLYIPLYTIVFNMWRRGEINGIRYGIVFPLFATFGSLFVLLGSMANPQFKYFIGINLIPLILGYFYGGKALDRIDY
ncbi:MAG TPA: APC family permease [Anaerovoracaceae bacterium]|nr:APC family permease [Anaerovoracaceae bacterium]